MVAARFDALRTLAFGGISGTYANVGSALTHPARAFCISNNTNGDLIMSVNGGTTDQLFVPKQSEKLYDVTSDCPPTMQTDGLVLPIGAQFAAKQSTAPSSGAVWVEILYAQGE